MSLSDGITGKSCSSLTGVGEFKIQRIVKLFSSGNSGSVRYNCRRRVFFTPYVLVRFGMGILPRESNPIGYVFPLGFNALPFSPGREGHCVIVPYYFSIFYRVQYRIYKSATLCSRSSPTRLAVRYMNGIPRLQSSAVNLSDDKLYFSGDMPIQYASRERTDELLLV